MDFYLQTLDNEKLRYYESENDSSIQLVFVPGILNPEIWKHQLRYFSKNYRTACFDCIKGKRTYEKQQELLKKILDQDQFNNTVLVAHGWANSLVQDLEHREEVIATALTGAWRTPSIRPPRELYKLGWRLGFQKPKMSKKFFFSEKTGYEVVKNFISDVERPCYEEFKSFMDNSLLRKPVKNSLIIHSENDRFSERKVARKLKPNASMSLIKSAGSFCFYEKPEAYNKALLDFLKGLEGFVQSRKVSHVQEKNRSLKEFARKRTKEKAVIKQ